MKNLALMESQDLQLKILNGRNPVKASDLRRFIDPQGDANDEVVNFFVELCMLQPEAFQDYAHLEPLQRNDYLVVSSFLYPKIRTACLIKSEDSDVMVAVWEPIMRWHTQVKKHVIS